MLDRAAIFKNSVGTEFRLLAVTGNGLKKTAHVFNMGDPKALPRQWKLSELVEGLEQGEYQQLPTRRMPVVTLANLNAPEEADASTKTGTERWKVIEPLVNDPGVLLRAHRGRIVEKRAKELGCSENMILTCLRLYWRGGMTKDALRGAFANCGISKDGPITEGRPARGRKPRDGRYVKFDWNPDLKNKVTATIKRLLRRKNKNTQAYIYRGVISEHFCVINPDGSRTPRPLGERPTAAQVRYIRDSLQTLEEKLRREHGDDNFENNFEPKTGSARGYAGGIAQYYEIDSTIPDIWICADADQSIVIGKATLYLIIDVFSRLIVGFHLTLDKPSWAGALEAMMSLVEDKRQLCERWGVEYREEDWCAHGVWPAFFRADRGAEFIGYASDTICDNLETGIINTPARKAPRKGTVECNFKLTQIPLKEAAGGYTPPREFRVRQTEDRRKLATRTLRSVGQELLESCLLQNRKVHKGMKLPANQVYRRVQPIPRDIWIHEYKNSAGALTRYDPDYLRFKLLPTERLSVTPNGVSYKGLLWEPERNLKQRWLLPATQGHYKVKVTLDRRLVDVIYVHDTKDPTKWTTMQLTPQCSDYIGMSFAQYEALYRARNLLNEEADEHNLRLEIEHDRAVIAREQQARVTTQSAIWQAGGRSRTTKGKEVRDMQAEIYRMKTTVLKTTAAAEPVESKAASAQVSIETPVLPQSKPSSSTPVTEKGVPMTAANSALQAILNLRKIK